MVLKEIKIGDKGTVELFIESVSVNTARNGKDYQSVVAKDTDGKKVKLTNFNNFVTEKTIINGNVSCSEYEGHEAYTLMSWVENKELNSTNFMPKAQIDTAESWKEVIKMVKTIRDVPCCRLACKVLTKELNKIKVMPLTASDQYSRVSGLLEATLKLMKMADAIATIEGLDRDLMVAAASVYYIGSINMVDEEFQPTREVALKGFDIASHDRLVEANKELITSNEQLDEERFLIFDNILLSRYQGKPTATEEAFTMKMLDSIVQVNENGRKKTEGIMEGTYVKENDLRFWYKRLPITEKNDGEADKND